MNWQSQMGMGMQLGMGMLPPSIERPRIEALARLFRRREADFAQWAAGYGVIRHDPLTQIRVREMVDELVARGSVADAASAYAHLRAADMSKDAAARAHHRRRWRSTRWRHPQGHCTRRRAAQRTSSADEVAPGGLGQ